MIKRKLNKKRLALFILLLVTLFSTLGLSIFSFSKFLMEDSKKTLVVPNNFIFNSNYLKLSSQTYNIFDLENELKIELCNSNTLEKSEIDIPYTVTVVNGTSNVSTGTLTTSENMDTITITPNNTNNPVIVSVSSNTYNYVLSATFVFADTGNNSFYTFTNNGAYYELSINTSSNDISSLTINWNSNYAPDNTNPLMENWTGTTGNLSLNNNSKYTLVFFKNTNTAYADITNKIIQNNTITLP